VAFGAHLDQHRRLLIAALLGAAAATAASFFCPWQLSALAGWDVAAAFVVGSVWSFIVALDAEATRHVATREDDSRTAVDLIMVIASVVSLVGVVVGLAHARDHHGVLSAVLTGVAVFTVLLSWFTVHTLFVLRYAHLYYNEPVGGIEFSKTPELPDYLDFVYVAFTIGMTFQVSDTQVTNRSIRRTVIRHSLLSYLFGALIVGVVINVVGNLIR
jgi:uncharacterized membrane protein